MISTIMLKISSVKDSQKTNLSSIAYLDTWGKRTRSTFVVFLLGSFYHDNCRKLDRWDDYTVNAVENLIEENHSYRNLTLEDII